MEKTTYLLDRTKKVINNYEEKSIKSGEKFNVFSILKLESNEVKTHSAFLGELLNPKGSHGMKTRFLELFLEEIFGKENSLIPESTSIGIEEHVGKINCDYTEGGRIDIILKDKSDNVILIENKIYAGEQKNQLIRYKNAYPNAKILFLTLFGNDSFNSEGLNAEIDYHLISYENQIIQWLKKCLILSESFPSLKHILEQYIVLLKKLTYQTTNDEMKKEVIELIKENYLESYEISRNFNSAKKDIIENFIFTFRNELLKKLGNSWKINNTDLIKSGSFNYILLSQESDDCFFYFRYNNLDSKNSLTTFGIILNEKLIKKGITGIGIYNDLGIKAHKTGNQSIIYKIINELDFSNPSYVENIIKNEKTLLEEVINRFISFIDNNTQLYNEVIKKINIIKNDKNIN